MGFFTGHCKYGTDLSKQLTNYLRGVLDSCGSVRISFSRRTPDKVANFVRKELGDHPKIYVYDGEEPNPHMGHLAWADAFIVTADSISMLSEACSTGKPVYVVGAERCKWKFAEFHKTLRERGLVRPFTGLEDVSFMQRNMHYFHLLFGLIWQTNYYSSGNAKRKTISGAFCINILFKQPLHVQVGKISHLQQKPSIG
ncbi:putative mitochondrial fission protein ELM1 [Helianthus annuus]|nr:putative mitochondrial fission protein ELM1 [Helianthus annuus]KAJ0659613.1 putative mitochondrial fission protein ELM1 [Helianthus annuus]